MGENKIKASLILAELELGMSLAIQFSTMISNKRNPYLGVEACDNTQRRCIDVLLIAGSDNVQQANLFFQIFYIAS